MKVAWSSGESVINYGFHRGNLGELHNSYPLRKVWIADFFVGHNRSGWGECHSLALKMAPPSYLATVVVVFIFWVAFLGQAFSVGKLLSRKVKLPTFILARKRSVRLWRLVFLFRDPRFFSVAAPAFAKNYNVRLASRSISIGLRYFATSPSIGSKSLAFVALDQASGRFHLLR